MLPRATIYRRLFNLGQSLRTTRRAYSTSPPTQTSQIARIEARLPRFLQRIVTPLRHAPVSHITAFLILHELTAVVPLFGLAGIFHYTHWLPPYISEWKWVHEGTNKFGNYMKKKGWIAQESKRERWWGRGEGGVKIVVELATAYAITKALLPLRLVLSVWGTPWFARWTVVPITQRVGRLFGAKAVPKVPSARLSPAAGTGATGGGVLPTQARP